MRLLNNKSLPLAALILIGTVAFSQVPQTADHVVVFKSQRKLQLLRNGKVIREYRVALGGDPVGPKTRQGDHKTPEGNYIVDHRNAYSHFHKALHISYPNPEERARAKAAGLDPGGDIMIHGIMNGLGWIGKAHRLTDWTDGCIAVTDEEIEEIWNLVPDGTPVEIRP